jgi:hypothetical protein
VHQSACDALSPGGYNLRDVHCTCPTGDLGPITQVRGSTCGGQDPRKDSRRRRSHQAVRSQETTPNGLSTEVPNLPSQRARIRFFAKSSVFDVSDHYRPTPWVSGVHDHRIDGQHMTDPGRLADGGHDRHPEHRLVAGSYGRLRCSIAFVDDGANSTPSQSVGCSTNEEAV